MTTDYNPYVIIDDVTMATLSKTVQLTVGIPTDKEKKTSSGSKF